MVQAVRQALVPPAIPVFPVFLSIPILLARLFLLSHLAVQAVRQALVRHLCPASPDALLLPILLEAQADLADQQFPAETTALTPLSEQAETLMSGGGGGGGGPLPPPTFESMPPDPPSQLAPTPLKCYVLAANHVVRFTRPSGSVFAYCKQSKTGAGEGLGTRLVCISRSRGSRPA